MKTTYDQFPINILEMNGKIKKQDFTFRYSNYGIYQNGECINSFEENGEIAGRIINSKLQIRFLENENVNSYIKSSSVLNQISTNIDRIIWSKNLENPESCIVENEPDVLSLFFCSGILVRASFLIYNPSILIEFNTDDPFGFTEDTETDKKSSINYDDDFYDYEDYLVIGMNKYDEENYEDAIANCNKSLSIAYFLRGISKSKLGDYQGAILDFDNCIQYDPENAHAYYDRALAKEQINNFAGAIEDYTLSIHFDPNDCSSYFNRSSIKCKLMDFEGSLNDLKIATQLAPERSDIQDAIEIVKKNMAIKLINQKTKKSNNFFKKFFKI